MNLKVYGEISAYYVQTLCLIFFPGEHFPVSDAENEELACTVSVEMRPEGAFSSVVLGNCCTTETAQYLHRPLNDYRYPTTGSERSLQVKPFSSAHSASAKTHLLGECLRESARQRSHRRYFLLSETANAQKRYCTVYTMYRRKKRRCAPKYRLPKCV